MSRLPRVMNNKYQCIRLHVIISSFGCVNIKVIAIDLQIPPEQRHTTEEGDKFAHHAMNQITFDFSLHQFDRCFISTYLHLNSPPFIKGHHAIIFRPNWLEYRRLNHPKSPLRHFSMGLSISPMVGEGENGNRDAS